MGNTKQQQEASDNIGDDRTGSETHSANTGVIVPNDAASYDPDYDPGASELSEDLAEEFKEHGPGLPGSAKG